MSSSADSKPPRASATVMLLREAADGLEVLMTRRHEKLAFMGGLWVFPGGTLHTADAAPRMLARISNPAACQQFTSLQGEALSTQQCLGLLAAACRETFEETGVLLAVAADDHPCPEEVCSRLQSERRAVATQSDRFVLLLEREQLLLDARRLVYWAHWITPSRAPRRFDTHFFAVALHADQAVTPDATETTECRWLTPASILSLADRAEMPLSPPTLCTLIDLQDSYGRHGSLRTLLAAEERRSVPPILPKMHEEDAQTTIVLPWDEHYASLPGESAPAHIEYPSLLKARLSRLALRRR